MFSLRRAWVLEVGCIALVAASAVSPGLLGVASGLGPPPAAGVTSRGVAPSYDASPSAAAAPALSTAAPHRNDKLSSLLDRLRDADDASRRAGRQLTKANSSDLAPDLQSAVTEHLLNIDANGRVQVFIDTTVDPAATLPQLTALGLQLQRTGAADKTIQAALPISALDAASAVDGVRLIRTPDRGVVQTGSLTSQGDTILVADTMRSAFAVNGSGVKVGIISDGMAGLAASQASNDLASVDTTTCDMVGAVPAGEPGNPTDANAGAEGTAMAEIVHDLAPGASIVYGYFGIYTSTAGTSLDFNAAVNCLAQNADVVLTDLVWFNAGLYDGTSSVSTNAANALNSPTNRIRGFYQSAGNYSGTHYQETYVDSNPGSAADNRHAFSGTAQTTDMFGLGSLPIDPMYASTGDTLVVSLQWNEPFGGATSNYDLSLSRHTTGTEVASSTGPQSGTQDPTEFIVYKNTGAAGYFDVSINKVSGVARTLDMFVRNTNGCYSLAVTHGPCLNYDTAASSIPNLADANGGVVALGAIDASDPGNDTIEWFSSFGPTNDGRTKPDATAIDGVSVTGALGPLFFGTSAAAPHAGAVAALLLSCNPLLRKGEPGDNPAADRTTLRAALLSSATDLGVAGTDNTFGSGLLNANSAATAAGCQPDTDADAVPQFSDNCPLIANAGQLNTDAAPIVTAGLPNDVSVPNGDGLGDACDPDRDNDGLPDATEADLGPVGAAHASCPGASAPTNPLLLDSDGDRIVDGAECALGSDPMNAASRPAAPAIDSDLDGLGDDLEIAIGSNPNKVDSDSDGISDGIEYMGYNTSLTNVNTDGDQCKDGREIASVNSDELVNSADQLLIAQHFGTHNTPAVLDITKDGRINSADLLVVAKNFNSFVCTP